MNWQVVESYQGEIGSELIGTFKWKWEAELCASIFNRQRITTCSLYEVLPA